MDSHKLKPFGTRLDEDLIKEVKIHSTKTDVRVREIVDQALRDYLAAVSLRRGPADEVHDRKSTD
jgi:hypothetical protein